MRWKVVRNGTWIDLGNGTELLVADGHVAQRLTQSHNDGVQELEDELKKYRDAERRQERLAQDAYRLKKNEE